MTVRRDSRFVSVLAVSTSGDAARVDMPLTASIAWSGFLHSRSPPPEGQTMQFSKRSYTAIGAFAAIALSAGFVGCSGGDTSGGDASGGDAAGELKDTYTVATDSSFVPFEFEEDGEHVGFDMDIINGIAEEAGFDVKLEVTNFDGI